MLEPEFWGKWNTSSAKFENICWAYNLALYFFWQKNVFAKAARKMFVKLTTGRRQQRLANPSRSRPMGGIEKVAIFTAIVPKKLDRSTIVKLFTLNLHNISEI